MRSAILPIVKCSIPSPHSPALGKVQFVLPAPRLFASATLAFHYRSTFSPYHHHHHPRFLFCFVFFSPGFLFHLGSLWFQSNTHPFWLITLSIDCWWYRVSFRVEKRRLIGSRKVFLPISCGYKWSKSTTRSIGFSTLFFFFFQLQRVSLALNYHSERGLGNSRCYNLCVPIN